MDYNTNKYLKAPLSPLIIFYLDQNYSTKEFKIIAEGDTIWSSNNQLVFDNNFCYFNQLPNPHDMDLSEFQKLWNSIGCKSQLNNDSIKSWRNQTFEKVISDMLNYQRLTSNCSGNDAQNEFCRPGECHNTSTMPLSDFQSIWNQAGCKSQLTENDIKIWRHKKYEEVQADIARYGQLSSNCEGDETINDLVNAIQILTHLKTLITVSVRMVKITKKTLGGPIVQQLLNLE
jgi:hypothetical protein